MPRTGGVYSPPAGTKGVPNTTILSNAYNSFVDDLTADANAARPITAGGTGSTSASAARTALGLAIGTNVQAYDAGLQSISGLTTVANQMLYTTATDVYATTALTPFARTILDDADAAAVKTTLGLAAIASSGSASHLITGTTPDLVLPNRLTGVTVVLDAVSGGWNTATVPGYYTGRAGTENAPNGSSYMGHVMRHNSAGYVRQEVWTASSPSPGYVRFQINNVWGSWEPLHVSETDMDSRYALAARTISAGTGLSGGGDLSANRTLTVSYGTTAGTATQGNDTRVVNAVQTSRSITAGNGLSGGGNLSADRSFSVNYGTTAGTAAEGNDSRIVNAVPNTRTISAGTGLTGGGTLAADRSLAVAYGTAAGTAAQGNDSRIVNAVPNTRSVTAGTGLTGGGTLAADRSLAVSYGTAAGTAAQGNDSRIVNAVPNTRTVTAGNGMTGGGALSANITVTMGTPGSITNSTTNSVSSTSHVHALGFVAAEVYTGSAIGELNYPVGTVILFDGYHDMNQLVNLYYNSGNSRNLNYSGVGTLVAGSWRMRGSFTSPQFGLCQRVA